MSSYFDEISNLVHAVPVELVDFNEPRSEARMPTQASSQFIINKEQGDWAEDLIMRAINESSHNFIAVHYGKSDELVAGEEGFADFFKDFQQELDTIGKRPDLLVFRKEDFRSDLGTDISKLNDAEIHEYVKKAVAGIEVRSSSFLFDKYEKTMRERVKHFTKMALERKEEILGNYLDLLSIPSRAHYIEILNSLNENTILAADFKLASWHSNARLIELSRLLKELKTAIKEVQKRDFLSITPKVEDLKVVYKWIETYGVPHFYFQVFFDKAYGISFKDILQLVSDPAKEGTAYFVESDTKNQNKTTIKINSKEGKEIASKVEEPSHMSCRKELDRGRLLFYVAFEGGAAYLDIEKFCQTLGISPEEF